jgi:hypothetical protein
LSLKDVKQILRRFKSAWKSSEGWYEMVYPLWLDIAGIKVKSLARNLERGSRR